MQYHHVPLEDAVKLKFELANVGLSSREACGNTVRNVISCPLAGVCRDEVFDTTPYLSAYVRYFIRKPFTQNMPRKFKSSFSPCANDCANAPYHDIGFIAKVQNGEKGFAIYVGGGNAKLVMTGEEILDSGVQVMAQPPGKKNATIHLLSGGEKALTATALVFSIFQLNPAPFCLLDEVDAPLDDSNTERFCTMVKRMASQTQFLFISHNKIAMEMAEQLIGVTMQEQGVSRIVAVDMEAALGMAHAA